MLEKQKSSLKQKLSLNPKAKRFVEKYILHRTQDNAIQVDVDTSDLAADFQKRYSKLEKRIQRLKNKADQTRIGDHLSDAAEMVRNDQDEAAFASAFRALDYVQELIDKAKDTAAAAKKNKHKKVERKAFLKSQKKTPEVMRETKRVAHVKTELKSMKAAVAKLEADMDDLRQKSAAATSLRETRANEAEFTNKRATRDRLLERIDQFEHFRATSRDRVNLMLDADSRWDASVNDLQAITQIVQDGKLGDDIAPLQDAVSSVYFVFEASFKDAAAKNAELTTKVDAQANRVLRGAAVTPNEPEVTALSDNQAKLLNDCLSLAQKLLQQIANAGRKSTKEDVENTLKNIQALHNKVAADMAFFVSCRNVGLMPPKEAKVDEYLALKQKLDSAECQLMDLFAQADPSDKAIQKQIADLRADLSQVQKDALAADKSAQRDFTSCQADYDSFLMDLNTLIAAVPVPSQSAGAQQAQKVANKLGSQLAEELFKTKLLTGKQKDLVDYPGKDWGPGGRPDKFVPYDTVITTYDQKGDAEYHQIAMKKEKGAFVAKRDDNKIPVSIMEMLKGRVDALQAMSETMVVGCDDVLKAYAAETETMMAACTSDSGRTVFVEVEKQIKKLEKNGLKKKVVQEFRLDALPQLEADWNSFRKAQPTMLPKEAYDAVFGDGSSQGLKERIETLVKDAEALKKEYTKNDSRVANILFDLHATGSEDTSVGWMTKWFVKDRAKQFLKVASAKNFPDPTMKDRITKAMEEIKQAKLKSTDYQGKLRPKYEEGRRFNEMKTEGGIAHATTVLTKLQKDVEALRNDFLVWRSNSKADDIAKEMAAFVDQLEEMADGSTKEKARRAEYDALDKIYSSRETALFKSSLFKMNSKEHMNRLSMVQSRKKAIDKDLKKYEQFETAAEHLKPLLDELAQLIQVAREDETGLLTGPDFINVKKRFDVLHTSIQALARLSDQLVPSQVKPRLSDVQQGDRQVQKGLSNTDAALKKVSAVVDLSTLDKACSAIHAKGDRSKSQRRKEREAALSALHKVRTRLEKHPSVDLYRQNPFDNGIQFVMVRNNLHNLEIGILASVDPRQH